MLEYGVNAYLNTINTIISLFNEKLPRRGEFLNVLSDDLAIFDEVIDERDDGHNDGCPQHNVGNEAKFGNICDEKNDRRHLQAGLDLAKPAGSDDDILICGHKPKTTDDEFARDDYDNHPARNAPEVDQADECGANK